LRDILQFIPVRKAFYLRDLPWEVSRRGGDGSGGSLTSRYRVHRDQNRALSRGLATADIVHYETDHESRQGGI